MTGLLRGKGDSPSLHDGPKSYVERENSRGWGRTSGLRVQSPAFVPAQTTRERSPKPETRTANQIRMTNVRTTRRRLRRAILFRHSVFVIRVFTSCPARSRTWNLPVQSRP